MTDVTEGLPQEQQDMLVAATDMVGRTGAADLQIRWCEEEKPTVWMAVAAFKVKAVGCYTKTHHEVAAGMDPVQALVRLLYQLLDGGECTTHCSKPTGVTTDVDQMPMAELVCLYQYDPELKTFRRGCEGDS